MAVSAKRALALLSEIAETRRLFMATETALADGVESPCITVTSARRGEGKTLMSVALACESARQLSKPVLLIDLNWYRPALHDYFDVSRDTTVRTLAEEDALQKCSRPSGVEGLDLLVAPLPYESGGEPPPDAGDVVARLIRNARSQYGMVWMDCHSIFPANRWMVDPLAVARRADLVLLSVLAGVTPRQDAKRARMMLEMSGARNVSVVLNQWRNPLS